MDVDPYDLADGSGPEQTPPTTAPPWFAETPPEGTARRVPRRTFTPVAWLIILALCTLAAVGQAVSRAPTSSGEDKLGLMLMRLQSQYFVYAAQLQGGGGLIYQQAKVALNIGTIDQRQRFVPLAGELQSPEEALTVLTELEELIEKERAGPDGLEVTEEQQRLGELLRTLYVARVGGDEQPLDTGEQQFLVDQLDWFGSLALNPAGESNDDARRGVMAPGQGLLVLFVGAIGLIGVGGVFGFLGLVVLLVLALVGRLPGGLSASRVTHGVYAETFAVWLLMFIGFQILAALAGTLIGSASMMPGLVAFFLSLLALVWPVWRGVPWSQVRRDIGWTAGREPILEPLIGVGGYLMGLPLLGIGIVGTLLLLLLQQMLAGDAPPFGPSGGPAHPVIEQLGGPAWWPKIQVLMLASVAAPVVEETMFRGVLYRHLRMATGVLPTALSVVLSGLIGGFLFAIIHPQGWVAVPALMSLAFAFTLAREWRDTLIVPMIMHGVSNGLVLTLLMAALAISAE